jgi:hypothetical protein
MRNEHLPAKVTIEDMNKFGVSKPGWYVLDNNQRVVDGPYSSRDAAIRGREVGHRSLDTL